jgi:hypothetical protein
VRGEFTIAEAVQFLLDARLEDTHTAIPGIVTKYSGHSTRLATVQPAIRLPRTTGADQDIPPIGGVPVVFPSSSAGTLFFPINPGDGVLLVFSEVAMGRYLKSSGHDLADAGSFSRHRLTDAIAIPGLWAPKAAPTYPSDADQNSTVLVSREGALVELGATVGIRNGMTDLHTEMNNLWTDLIQLRTDLAAQFGQLAAGVTGDASFLVGTVAAATAAGLAQTAAIPVLTAHQAQLSELLK